jgi:methylglyoxal synthase
MAEKNNLELLRLCDIHNIPIATNIASAEILVRALERGDLDWREIVNPRSDYNIRKKVNSFR